MADNLVGFKATFDTTQATQGIGSLRKQLKEAQAEVQSLSDKFGATSEQAVAAAKKAADLKDRIGDAKALTDAFNPDRKFQAFASALTGVVGGISAVQGAMGLLGVKNEEIEKTLLKVNSAMALSQGLNSILEARDSFKNLGTVISNLGIIQKTYNFVMYGTATATKAADVATKATATSMRILRGVMASLGIGLLIVGVTTLISKISDWMGSTEDNEAAQKSLNDTIEYQNQLLDDNLKGISNATKMQVLRAKEAGKSGKEIHDIEIKGLQDEAAALKQSYQDRLKYEESPEFRKQKLEDQKKYRDETLKINKQYTDKNMDIMFSEQEFITSTAEQNRQTREKNSKEYQQGLKEEADARRQLLEDRNNFILETNDLIKKDVDNSLDFIKNRTKQIKEISAEGIKKLDEKIIGDVTKSLQQRIEVTNSLTLSAQDQELALLGAQHNERMKVIAGNHLAEEKENEDYERRKADVKLKYENLKLDIVKSSLSNIANVVGKETAAGKAIAIASATIDTYQAANKALKADYGVFGPAAQVARFVAVASTIAAGIKNVKEIAKAKVPGGASISAPSGLNASPITPPTPQATMTQLDQRSINQLGSATNRAYVVETDITNSQERIRRINRAARLN
jgi:hypothetical protein